MQLASKIIRRPSASTRAKTSVTGRFLRSPQDAAHRSVRGVGHRQQRVSSHVGAAEGVVRGAGHGTARGCLCVDDGRRCTAHNKMTSVSRWKGAIRSAQRAVNNGRSGARRTGKGQGQELEEGLHRWCVGGGVCVVCKQRRLAEQQHRHVRREQQADDAATQCSDDERETLGGAGVRHWRRGQAWCGVAAQGGGTHGLVLLCVVVGVWPLTASLL